MQETHSMVLTPGQKAGAIPILWMKTPRPSVVNVLPKVDHLVSDRNRLATFWPGFGKSFLSAPREGCVVGGVMRNSSGNSTLGACPQEAPVAFPRWEGSLNGPACGNYLHLGTRHLKLVFEAWNQSISVAPAMTEEPFSPHLNARW